MPEIVTFTTTLFTLSELKKASEEGEIDGVEYEVSSSAYQDAFDSVALVMTDYGWWETALDALGKYDFPEKYGLTFEGSQVRFDLDRGSKFTLPADTEIDTRVFLKKAGIDLRTKDARLLLEYGFVIGVRYDRNYVDVTDGDVTDATIEKLEDLLTDATHYGLKTLRDEMEYLTSEEQVIENADANGYTFTADGRIS